MVTSGTLKAGETGLVLIEISVLLSVKVCLADEFKLARNPCQSRFPPQTTSNQFVSQDIASDAGLLSLVTTLQPDRYNSINTKRLDKYDFDYYSVIGQLLYQTAWFVTDIVRWFYQMKVSYIVPEIKFVSKVFLPIRQVGSLVD